MTQNIKQIYWVFIIILGLISISVAWYATSIYGVGVGTDGALQISTAENLTQGNGLQDYAGDPFVKWPSLYPFIIATLSWSTGVDALTIGWLLNIFSYGLVVWLGGVLFFQNFSNNLVWAFLGSLVVASSTSLLSIAVNLGTDVLFTALTLAYLLVAVRYLESAAWWRMAAMGLLACAASMVRIPGITLILTGALLILYAERQNIYVAARKALLFSVLTFPPVFVWAIGTFDFTHNSFFGIPLFKFTSPLANLKNALIKIAHWFVPYGVAQISLWF